MEESLTSAIDRWREKQDGELSRPKPYAVLSIGLNVETKISPSERLHAARADRAKELASRAIEKMIDPAAPPEERAQCKRRLTKGPTKFREARVDQPRTKVKWNAGTA